MIAMKIQFGDKAVKCPLSFDSIDLITFNYYVYVYRPCAWSLWPCMDRVVMSNTNEYETKVILRGCYYSVKTHTAPDRQRERGGGGRGGKMEMVYLLINN